MYIHIHTHIYREREIDRERERCRLYRYIERHTYGGFYFVCDHGKHRNAKRYNFGCNLLLGAKKSYTPNCTV